ncbi:hypothetical protein LSTR_LSTR006567 [Laodelphax striatellus]|uniref:Odorant receptor n=1 Tax=Laodelphax striatellus TaxID=195883 RepID=A0A482WVS2_LAOST|nr:hypothetical protein LSTR_LSTR006567 [Laodelphax striatellus]
METISTVKRAAAHVGHLQNGGKKLRAKLHFVYFIINAINLILSLLVDSNKTTVIMIIKEFNNILFVMTIHSGFDGTYTLCNAIEGQLQRKFLERILPKATQVSKKQLVKNIDSILVNSRRILMFVFVLYNFFPIFQTIYILVTRKTGDDIDIQKLPFIFYFHYFSYSSSLTLYFTVSIVQIVCSGTTIVLLFCVFNSGFIAVKSLVFEIKMTSQCLRVINEQIADYDKERRNGVVNDGERENSLKGCFRYLIMQHQSICR